MSPKALSILLHSVEALVVLSAAIFVAHRFPEYQMQALAVVFAILSAGAKGARISDVVPVKDYVNAPMKEE